MKRTQINICVGHGAYKGINAAKYHTTKTAAVNDLRTRTGITRDKARTIITDILQREYGWQCIEVMAGVVEVKNYSNTN